MKASKKVSAFDSKPQVDDNRIEKNSAWEKRTPKKLFITKALMILLAFAAVGAGAYYVARYQNARDNTAIGTEKEAQEIVEKVGELVELPEEVPTIATVSDVSKLKGQQFFKNAKDGDKVLIYQNTKKAILYRPSTNKIVEFGPINLGSASANLPAGKAGQNTASSSATITLRPVRVAVYNGTKAPGLATAAEKQLLAKAPNVTVVAKGNAAKQDHAKTLIIDVTGGNTAEAQSIAELLKGSIAELPEGQKATSSADILIILGR